MEMVIKPFKIVTVSASLPERYHRHMCDLDQLSDSCRVDALCDGCPSQHSSRSYI